MSYRPGVLFCDRVVKALIRISRQRYIRRAELSHIACELALRTGSHRWDRTVAQAFARLGLDTYPARVGIVRGAPLAPVKSPLYRYVLAAEVELEKPKFVRKNGNRPVSDATVELHMAHFLIKGIRAHGR